MLGGFKPLPLPIDQLCLSTVLKCGQSFRWTMHQASPPTSKEREEDGASNDVLPLCEYRCCIKDRVICLRQSKDTLFYRSIFPDEEKGASSSTSSVAREAARNEETLAFIRDYFQLDIDLEKLYDDWASRDIVFGKLRDRFVGIRMLKQDPWECLVSCVPCRFLLRLR